MRLASPPPLDRPLALEAEAADGAILVRLLDRGHLVASGTASADLVDDVPPAVTLEQARAAETRLRGAGRPPVPHLLRLRHRRDPGDGAVPAARPLDDGTGRYAAAWVPAR